jgi:hypothetical protein
MVEEQRDENKPSKYKRDFFVTLLHVTFPHLYSHIVTVNTMRDETKEKKYIGTAFGISQKHHAEDLQVGGWKCWQQDDVIIKTE